MRFSLFMILWLPLFMSAFCLHQVSHRKHYVNLLVHSLEIGIQSVSQNHSVKYCIDIIGKPFEIFCDPLCLKPIGPDRTLVNLWLDLECGVTNKILHLAWKLMVETKLEINDQWKYLRTGITNQKEIKGKFFSSDY